MKMCCVYCFVEIVWPKKKIASEKINDECESKKKEKHSKLVIMTWKYIEELYKKISLKFTLNNDEWRKIFEVKFLESKLINFF